MLALQRTAGNAAVTGLLTGARGDAVARNPVVQRCGDVPAQECPCHADSVEDSTAGAVQRQSSGGGSGPPSPPSLPVVGAACDPFTSATEAGLAHTLMVDQFLPRVGSHFGTETQSVWSDYLSRGLPVPRPGRRFDTPGGEIVEGFRRHPQTATTEALLVDLAAAALRATPRTLPPNTPVTIPLADLVTPGAVWALLNAGADRMRFSNALTIPGLLAGGIDPAADTRNAWGEMVVTNHADPLGTTTDVTITPRLTFAVEDNVKFCPGNPGSFFIQPLTIPLSRLEATGTRFGAPFAGIVPFSVLFSGSGRTKSFGTTVPVTPPIPAPPSPPPTPTPTRGTGPAHTTGTHLRIRTGPGTDHEIVGKFPQRGAPITVLEQVEGTEIRGNNLWDRIDGGWVSDSYVEFAPQP